MKKYGFIGTGNMGFPLLKGAVSLVGAENVTYSTPFPKEMEKIKELTGVEGMANNIELAGACENVVICVKPQFIKSVLADLKQAEIEDITIVSIAAGVSIEKIKSGVGNHTALEELKNVVGASKNIRFARIMPNTPAMVGEGMSCISFDPDSNFSDEQKRDVTALFEAVGKVEIIPERLMNAAMCANGSSPAYVFMFIEALADSVVKYGIPREQAYRLAAQSVLGSAKLVLESKEHPGRLKDNVCSPAGTTIVAVEALEENGFRNAVFKATTACYEKGEELGKLK